MNRKNLPKVSPRIIYAGDRDIAVSVLKFMLDSGVRPIALLVSDQKNASHDVELVKLCSHLKDSQILRGDYFKTKSALRLLQRLNPDYIICVHFPYIFPEGVLNIPRYGVLNLHPAFLPFNRGWHTAIWAIWDGGPFGASLHFMDKGLDSGDIIHQKEIEVYADDTADKLYRRVKKTELKVFQEAWPSIISGSYLRRPQPVGKSTAHKKIDISSLQHIDLNKRIKAGELIKRLAALTTNNLDEAAYFKIGERVYRVQIKIKKVKRELEDSTL